MAQMILRRGDRVLWTQPLSRRRTRIGRDPDAEIVLADPNVSRIHALIDTVNGQHRLLDNSRNGTRVNGLPEKVIRLHHGDEVKIGPFSLTYQRAATGETVGGDSTILASPRALVSYSARSNRLLSSQEVLVVKDGSAEPFVYAPLGKVKVGRGMHNDLILPGAGDLECELRPSPQGYEVRASTSHRVDINGQRCDRGLLPYGGRLTLGSATLDLRTEEGEESLDQVHAPNAFGMIGSSEAMKRVYTLIHRIAPLDSPAIILGETGTGKELVARALHQVSHRQSAPFIAINCGAISSELAESTLFGHAKGAFTGATSPRKGAFRQAHGGTLFLDEVGELPLHLQVKLLRVLETGTITPVGESRESPVDVRIIAATNRNLGVEVREGRFREDLFFRLFVLPIQLPPLRERGEDIELLVGHFLGQMKNSKALSPGAKAALEAHTWPGNVRELLHVLTRAVTTAVGEEIGVMDLVLLSDLAGPAAPEPLPSLVSLEEMERDLIVRTLALTPSKREAALSLGIARSTLHIKIRKYGLDV